MCDGSGQMSDYVVVSTTVSDASKADALALLIVGEKLAACVQQSAVKSTYRWDGEVKTTDEVLLTAKTRTELSHKLIHFIKDHHDYDVPELVVTPIISGGVTYLRWLTEQTSD